MEPSFLLTAMGGTDCERVGTGWLAQPANAVSSLAYVAVACWLLHDARRPENDRLVLVSSAAALAAVGAGSLAYHGPQPDWAPLVHDGSILGLGAVLFGVAARGLVLRRPLGEPRRWRAAGVWGAAGLVAYAAGRTGSRLCRPESVLQLHGIWHGHGLYALCATLAAMGAAMGGAGSRGRREQCVPRRRRLPATVGKEVRRGVRESRPGLRGLRPGELGRRRRLPRR